MTTFNHIQHNLTRFMGTASPSLKMPVPQQDSVLTTPKDNLSIRFSATDAVDDKKINPAQVNLSTEVYSLLTNVVYGFHYAASNEGLRNKGFNADNTWQISLGKYLLQNKQVQEYLSGQGIEPLELLGSFTSVDKRIEQTFNGDPTKESHAKGFAPMQPDPSNPRSLENAKYVASATVGMNYFKAQVVDKLKEWCANEGIESPTPVDLWRFTMKTKGTDTIFDQMLTRFLIKDEQKLARLAEAPAVSNNTSTSANTRATLDELAQLEAAMEVVPEKIIGQDKATRRFLDNIELSKLDPEVDDDKPHRPRVRAMLLGPSGTGKTYMLNTYAKLMDAVPIYVPMSQYKESMHVTKLTGASHGYDGFDTPSLSDIIAQTQAANPGKRIVLVLDEIEKAHPDARDVLMQPLDEGVLENSKLQKTYFDNVDIVMTSNIAQKKIEAKIKENPNVSENELEELVRKEMEAEGWKQEFVGRINNMVVFRTLEQDAIRKILDINLASTAKAFRLYGFNLTIENEMKDKIVEMVEPFRTKTGAREVIRYRERVLKTSLMKVVKELIKRDALSKEGTVGSNVHAHWSNSKNAVSFIFASPDHNFKFTFDDHGEIITEESPMPFKDDQGNDVLPPEKPELLKKLNKTA